jgi:hypothetical protein
VEIIDSVNTTSEGRTTPYFVDVKSTLELVVLGAIHLDFVGFRQLLLTLRIRTQEARASVMDPDPKKVMGAIAKLEQALNYYERIDSASVRSALSAFLGLLNEVHTSSEGIADVFFSAARQKIETVIYDSPYSSYLAYGEIVWLLREGIRVAREQLFQPRWQPALFVRGDSNADGKVNFSDPIHILNHLFLGGDEPACADAADADDDGRLTIGDAVQPLNYLFLGTGLPSPTFGKCGPDKTPLDRVSCAEPGHCS